MLANTRSGFFPVTNNELSISYGLTNFLETGIFYDLHNHFKYSSDWETKLRKQLIGVKVNLSFLSLMRDIGLKTNPTRFDVFISGYYGIHRFEYSKTSITGSYDKKDRDDWAHYYRLGARYFVFRNSYINASAGIYNTNRFYLGVGYKF